jgi:translocation and assembly module TamB
MGKQPKTTVCILILAWCFNMRRQLTHGLFVFMGLLMFTLAYSDMPISLQANLDSFSHDVDSATIRFEHLSTRWQLNTSAQPNLRIDQLKAKRLTITLKPSQSEPERIKLPLPIRVKQASIDEVVVISADGRQVFNDVDLAFEGDTQRLTLQLTQAKTPWGSASGAIRINPNPPFALDGTLALSQTSTQHSYDLSATLHGDANALEIISNAWLTATTPQHWRLVSSPPNPEAPAIQLKAQLSLLASQSFTANLALTNLHPEKLGHYPAALLNMRVTAHGQLSPTLKASLRANSVDSQWHQKPFEFSANAQLLDSSIESMQLLFKLGQNRFEATGSLYANRPNIAWQADFENLAQVDQRMAGRIQASGSMTGSLNEPQLQWQLLANDLAYSNQLRVRQLQGEANLDLRQQGSTDARFTASDATFNQQAPFNALLTLRGQAQQHQLAFNAEGTSLQLNSQLEGGLSRQVSDGRLQWIGQLLSFDFSGPTRIKLSAPARLLVDHTQLKLGNTDLQLTEGHVLMDYLTLSDSALSSEGHLHQVSMRDLPSHLLELPNSIQGNPIFSGEWRIEAHEQLNAKLGLSLASGDLSYRKLDNSMAPFGLNQASLTLEIIQNQATLSGQFNGSQMGQAKLELTTGFTKQDNRFTLLPEAPLRLNASADLHTLAWLPMPTALMDGHLEGQIKMNVQANGTLAAPNLSGQLLGQDIEFQLPSEGVAFSQGQWTANFAENRLTIAQASWQGGKGRLTSQGWATWQDGKPAIALDWHADKFSVLSRADRLLTLSGSGKTELANNLLTISGQFKVDEGLIELSNQDTPALGNDVVILGQTAEESTPTAEVLLSGLSIQLGDNFSLRGRGLDAMLTGSLTLNGLTQYRPHAQGSIKVSKGTFMAYGQVLAIERGIMNFSGVMDNPGLDIRAMRNSKPVNAGVEITGNAYNPAVKLVSDPNVAESEKLSWLVLGHGLENAGKNDYGMLSLAAGVILSQGQSVPLQTQLARAAGLDEFSFTGGDVEGASLTLGKRITSQIYLSYAKSITGLLDVARLTYNVTPRWLLRAEAGTESAVDVLYTFSFK